MPHPVSAVDATVGSRSLERKEAMVDPLAFLGGFWWLKIQPAGEKTSSSLQSFKPAEQRRVRVVYNYK